MTDGSQTPSPTGRSWVKWRRWLYLAAGLALLWFPISLAYLFQTPVGDAIPFLTPGAIELFVFGGLMLSILAIAIFLLFQVRGWWRWGAVAMSLLIVLGSGFFLTQKYRFVFDADMKPLRIETRDPSFKLEIEGLPPANPLPMSATSFTQFLGPDRNLTVDWLQLDRTARPDEYAVMWRRKIGFGWSGFTAVAGLAFTQEQHGPWEVISAYQIADGKLVWFHRTRHRHDDPAGGIGPRATPTFANNRIYAMGALGTLTCLEANSGQLIWQTELTRQFDLPIQTFNQDLDTQYDVEDSGILWGRAASPLVVGNKVIVPVGGPPGNRRSLAAFDRDSGDLIWSGGQRQASYGSPVLTQLLGTDQILITNEDTVAAYDPETGTELWAHDRPGSSSGDANTSQPIAVADNQVLMTKEYGAGGELVEVAVDAQGVWSTRSVWKDPRVLKTKLTVAAIRGDYAYAISGGILECVDWKTGQRQWRGPRVRHGQLLLVNDALVVVSELGELIVAAASPDEFREWAVLENILDGRCWNTLCIYDDLLLVRSELEATCIRLPVAEPVRINDETLEKPPGSEASPAEASPVESAESKTTDAKATDPETGKPETGNVETPAIRLPQTSDTRPSLASLNRALEAAQAAENKMEIDSALDAMIESYPEQAFAYYQRGCQRSWDGDFAGSLADFDRYVELRPEVERRLWERGIAQYYVGQFEAGAQQFQLYQSYHDNDVENSVWRFLCQAQSDGIAVAREQMLPIANDPRKPLMKIYGLFRGELGTEDVLAEINAAEGSDAEIASCQFYGHFYLALWYEMQGEWDPAKASLKQALQVPAHSPRVSQYMWDIARAHQRLWDSEVGKNRDSSTPKIVK